MSPELRKMAEEVGSGMDLHGPTTLENSSGMRYTFTLAQLEAFTRLVAADCEKIAKDFQYSLRPGERAHDAIRAKYGVKP